MSSTVQLANLTVGQISIIPNRLLHSGGNLRTQTRHPRDRDHGEMAHNQRDDYRHRRSIYLSDRSSAPSRSRQDSTAVNRPAFRGGFSCWVQPRDGAGFELSRPLGARRAGCRRWPCAAAIGEPADVFGRGQLDVGEPLPGSLLLDQLGLVQAYGRFHQRVVNRQSPTVPIEASIPASVRWAVSAKLVYCPDRRRCGAPGPGRLAARPGHAATALSAWRVAALKENSITTYTDRAGRFLKWLDGDYQPRNLA
jgi:hypothetical protein